MAGHVQSQVSPGWWAGVYFTLLSMAWGLLAPSWGLGFTDRIVAIVNKEVITRTELDHAFRDELSRLKAKYQGKEFEQRYSRKQRQVLNNLINERLQLQEAKAKGLTVTQDEIDAALRRTPLPPTQTEEDFGQFLLLKKLFEFEVRRNVVVEEEEVRRHYQANPNIFRTPPQYRLTQIFLAADTDEALAKAKLKAEAIYSEWIPDISLEDLVAQFALSVTPLGWVEEKDLVPPLAQVVKDLIPGNLSKPIETQAGVHLVIVEDVKESQPYPFERVEREIRANLLKERGEETFREWLKDLKQKAFIDIRL